MNNNYSPEMFHGMTFQQIMFRQVGKAFWWNLIIGGFVWWDAHLSGWTWVSYFLVGFLTLRAVVNLCLGPWIAKQPADRNIAKVAR